MQTITKFLKTIFLVDLLKGLWLTLKYTPQPAFTFQYPAPSPLTSPGTGTQTHCARGK